MQIQPSDANREFDTGAVRGVDLGKGLPSLLPWGVLRLVASCFDGVWVGLPWDATIEVARVYEAGARKYTPRNWEKGIPVSCFIDSAVRHFHKFWRGDEDEPHAAQYVWNLLGATQTHQWVCQGHRPEVLQDLPVDSSLLSVCDPLLKGLDQIDTTANHSMQFLAWYMEGRSPNDIVRASAHALAMLDHHIKTEPRTWLHQSMTP